MKLTDILVATYDAILNRLNTEREPFKTYDAELEDGTTVRAFGEAPEGAREYVHDPILHQTQQGQMAAPPQPTGDEQAQSDPTLEPLPISPVAGEVSFPQASQPQ